MKKGLYLLAALTLLFLTNPLFAKWGGYIYDSDYNQAFYDSFGDKIGDKMAIAYEFQVDGESDVGYSLRKSGRIFSGKLKNMQAISETPFADISLNITFQEKNKVLDWGGQILRNNLLDGIYLEFNFPKWGTLELINLFPIDFNVYDEDDYWVSSMASELGWGNDYTSTDNEASMVLMQGGRISFGEDSFPAISLGAIDAFNVKKLDIMALSTYNGRADSKAPFYKGSHDPNAFDEDGYTNYYVKIVCLDQNSPDAYAAIFSYAGDSTNTDVEIENAALLDETGVTDNGESYYIIRRKESAVFKVTGTTASTNLDALKSYFKLAGSYAVSVSPNVDIFAEYGEDEALDNVPLNTVAYDIPSVSATNDSYLNNIKTVEVSFGVPTANNILGFHTEFDFFTVGFELGLYKNFRLYRLPKEFGGYDALTSTSFFVKMNKQLKDLNISAQYYRTEPGYETRFPVVTNYTVSSPIELYRNVLDNDDNDFQTPIYGDNYLEERAEEFEGKGAAEVDINNNGVIDYNDDFLLIGKNKPFYKLGRDMNNNDIPDNYEDDTQLDFDVAPNIHGFRSMIDFNGEQKLKGLEVGVGGVYDLSMSQTELASKYISGYIGYGYNRGKLESMPFSFVSRYELKRVKDNLPNNVSSIEGVIDGEDEMMYSNSLAHSANLQFALSAIENFNFGVDSALRLNQQIDEKRSIIKSGISMSAIYNLDLSEQIDGMLITPMAKYEFYQEFDILDNMNDESTFIDTKQAIKVLALKMGYNMSPTMRLTAGVQIKQDKDILVDLNTENNVVSLLEFNIDAGNINLLSGYKFEYFNFADPDKTDYSQSKIYTLMLYKI